MANDNKKPGLLINRNFALILGGRIVSIAGDFLFDTTLVLWVAARIAHGQTWAPLAVSGVLLAAALPVFLIGPIAGVFVDRWDKRRTMLYMDAVRAILIALLLPFAELISLPFVTGSHLPVLWELGILYTIVFLASTCSQFFNPASLALTGDIVDGPYRARATGLTQMSGSLAMLAGPPLAALLFFAVGAQLAIFFDALSFAISFLATLTVQAPPSTRSVKSGEQGNFLREFAEGLRFSFGNPILLTILIAGFLVVLYEGALNTLGVFFWQQNLHAPLSLYGWFGSAMGAGMTLGALLAAVFAQRLGVAKVFSIGLTLSGVLVMVVARLTSFPPVLALQFILGILVAAVNVAVGPIMFHVVSKELIGRIAAIVNPVLSLSSLLSIAIVGYLDSTLLHNFHAQVLGLAFGPIDTILLGSGTLATIGGLYAVVKLRKVKIIDAKDQVSTQEQQAVTIK